MGRSRSSARSASASARVISAALHLAGCISDDDAQRPAPAADQRARPRQGGELEAFDSMSSQSGITFSVWQ